MKVQTGLRFGLSFVTAIAVSLGGPYLSLVTGHPTWGWYVAPLIYFAMDYVGFAQRSPLWLLGGICGNIAAWTGILYAVLSGFAARRAAKRMRPSNPRLQRTPLRAPLSRKPLAGMEQVCG